VTPLWIGLGVAAAVVVVLALRASLSRSDAGDLGTVSERWLSEERAHDRPYSKP
jgi:hypothetical protein